MGNRAPAPAPSGFSNPFAAKPAAPTNPLGMPQTQSRLNGVAGGQSPQSFVARPAPAPQQRPVAKAPPPRQQQHANLGLAGSGRLSILSDERAKRVKGSYGY